MNEPQDTPRPEWRHLGDMNGWSGKPPDAYVHCTAQKHQLTEHNIGRCYNRYSCPICRISYTVDSSD